MNNGRQFSALIYGAGGMTGGELLRILSCHPQIRIAGAVSGSKAGSAVGSVHPHIRHLLPGVVFTSVQEASAISADVAFTALPHGASSEIVAPLVERGIPVVDLSADFRLREPSSYIQWYGQNPRAEELLKKAVYGLPELHRLELAEASLASGVGCNATASIIALYPLAKLGLVQEASIDIRAGSSEGGARPSQGSHHPFRSRALRIVEPFSHRHLAEVSQELSIPEKSLTMRLSAVETVRGVQACAEVLLKGSLKERDLWKIYREAYENEPFVHICPARPSHSKFPDPRLATGSNNVYVGFALHQDGKRCLAVAALDNLMKGAAGTAVQAANVMMELPETAGLTMQPVYPV